MDTKSSGTTENNHEFSKKDTAAKIDYFKRRGFREDELIIQTDGQVDIGYIDEYRGIAQMFSEQMKKRDED